MTIQTLTIGDPFFAIRILKDESRHPISGKAIVLNLADTALKVREQSIGALQSVILTETEIREVAQAVLIEGYDDHSDEADLLARIRQTWPSAFQVRGEERLRGVEHYMSPKVWVGQYGFTLYHSASVPLNVGLHCDHAFCPVPGFREVHTQIIGFGKMQQCRERDVASLYLEETMAPGGTHRPMYDAQGNYPWHQYETITPSVFMAIEMLPEGAFPPEV
ncbi:hypothetical protein [Cognatiyoonia sp.]|uniref:hypothetical protein n=1 Tax=Cognatiyoonia sp. TaxID=2211652 RepID=UPI003F69E92B